MQAKLNLDFVWWVSPTLIRQIQERCTGSLTCCWIHHLVCYFAYVSSHLMHKMSPFIHRLGIASLEISNTKCSLKWRCVVRFNAFDGAKHRLGEIGVWDSSTQGQWVYSMGSLGQVAGGHRYAWILGIYMYRGCIFCVLGSSRMCFHYSVVILWWKSWVDGESPILKDAWEQYNNTTAVC